MKSPASNSHASRFFRRLALCAILSAASSHLLLAQAQDQDEVINVESNLIVLNVTVTDARGAYVHGLTKTDFQVFEDEKSQPISTFSVEDTPFAVAILLDSSGSMEGRMTLARAAAIRFLDSLRENDVAAVYRFYSKIELMQDFSSSRDLTSLAYGVKAEGLTLLNDAIKRAAQDLAKRSEKRKAILVLSDGADYGSRASQNQALDAALDADVTIYTVEISSTETHPAARPTASLRAFANKSGGRYISTPGGQALREAFQEISEELSNQYTIGYQMPAGARDGKWRTIAVTSSRPALKLRTRDGYRAPKK
jgi:Ca-activated chloride channel family protein